MNEPSTVTYPTADILKRIEDKLDSNHKELSKKIDKQSEEIGDIKVELVEIKAEVKNLNKDVTDLKGSTKAQIWTLIGILATAILGLGAAVIRFFAVTNP
ncbi:MAG: DUF1515 family protein [Crocosphaera sp.]|nr:DUF1515 family protein [Crocosphaera sp.]